MPRPVRIQYAGATYHVMCRGDRREEIFRDDTDRTLFLRTLEETCERGGFVVHSYVLMPNHYHFLLETPEANLVVGMRWFHGTYTARFNARHGVVGHLFQGRYKAIPIDSDEPEYFRMVSEYIHLNPVRAGLLDRRAPRPGRYVWSSYPAFSGWARLPGWLSRKRVFEAMDLDGEGPSSRRKFAKHMALRTREILDGSNPEELEREWQKLRRGWYVGGELFRNFLMNAASKAVRGLQRQSFEDESLRRHDALEASQLLDAVTGGLGVELAELGGRRQSDPTKQAVAWAIKTRTIVGSEWIAGKLGMGDASNVRRAVAAYRYPKDTARRRLRKKVLHICRD